MNYEECLNSVKEYRRKMQQGGELYNYKEWLKSSPKMKIKRNFNIAKSYILKGPSFNNLYNAGKAILGGFNPTNPNLVTGEPIILPSRTPYNVKQILDKNGLINTQKAVLLIKTGKQKAIDYLSSDVRKVTNAHNTQLAKRLGLKNFRAHAANRAATPSKLKLEVNNSTKGGGVSTDNLNPELDEVNLNLKYDPENAMFHETLHRGYVGNAPKEFYYLYGRDTFGDINKFYNFIKDKTLKPWSERVGLPLADYLDKSEELAVNLLEAGKEMGLKFGQKFPGNLEVLQMLEKFRKSGSNKVGIVQHLNLNKPKRIWRGLTGTLFGGTLLGGFNYELQQSNENL